jgi:50S ribosomal subunit-associated GTPase HflX
LEEVLEADLILHVRDIAHPDSAAQAEAELPHDPLIDLCCIKNSILCLCF